MSVVNCFPAPSKKQQKYVFFNGISATLRTHHRISVSRMGDLTSPFFSLFYLISAVLGSCALYRFLLDLGYYRLFQPILLISVDSIVLLYCIVLLIGQYCTSL